VTKILRICELFRKTVSNIFTFDMLETNVWSMGCHFANVRRNTDEAKGVEMGFVTSVIVIAFFKWM